MALTRKILADLGVPKEHIDAIMNSRDEILEGYLTVKESDTAVADAVAKAINEAKKNNPEDITKHPDYIKLQGDLTAKDAAIAAVKKDAAIQAALKDAKTKNTRAALALLEADKLELQEDGTVKGLKEALEGLQKSDAYLFGSAPPQTPPSGFNPPPGGADTAGLAQQIAAAQEAGNMALVASLIRQQAAQ